MNSWNQSLLIVCALFGLFFLVIVLSVVRDILKKRKEKRQRQAYREQYVRTVTLTDPMLGSIDAEYDTKEGTLSAEPVRLPQFGVQSPCVISADGYSPEMGDTVIRTVALAYERSDEILKSMAGKIQELLRLYAPEKEYDVNEIAAAVSVTEFHFFREQETLCMQMMAGAEIEQYMFSVSAVYHTDTKVWDYEIERAGD